jgi:hypothetical protein
LKKSKSKEAKEFLKKKERYDPKKSLKSKAGSVSKKGIDQKRVFKKGVANDSDSEGMSS